MKRYQQTKKELSVQAFDILVNRGYMMWEKVKSTLESSDYPTHSYHKLRYDHPSQRAIKKLSRNGRH